MECMKQQLRNSLGAIIGAAIILISVIYSTARLSPEMPFLHITRLKHKDPQVIAARLDADMVAIPPGVFLNGSNDFRMDERPQHQVYLDGFSIDRFEVTNVQYARFLEANDHPAPGYWRGVRYPPGHAEMPVVALSWQEASEYCTWVGKRLPTEAEWERACRGDQGQVYSWGDVWKPGFANIMLLDESESLAIRMGSDAAWQLAHDVVSGIAEGPSGASLRPVGSFPLDRSPYGVFDMLGNASEWVQDWYNWDGYTGLPNENPIVLAPEWNHSVRGQAWLDFRATQDQIILMSRCSARNSSHSSEDPRIGFRCAQ